MNEFDKMMAAEILKITDLINEYRKVRDTTTNHETPEWRLANLRIHQLTEVKATMKVAIAAYKKAMK